LNRPSINLARQLAYEAFVQVMFKNCKPEEVMAAMFETHDAKLKRLDRNFIKEILYGSIRWYSKIFWILQNTSRRDLKQTAEHIQAALVCGAYQIYYMDRVPDRAAVNESVEYVRIKGQASACTFINGILRQIARRSEYFTKPDKDKQQAEYLALQFAHPLWIVERWLKRFRFERMKQILASNNEIPQNTIRINLSKTPLAEVQTIQQALLKSERTHSERRPLRVSLRCKEFPRTEMGSLFDQGYFTIQDEAAQLIGYLVAPQPDEIVIDACSAPGGKLSQLRELCDSAKLIALDDNPKRLELAQQTCARLGHEDIDFQVISFLDYTPEQKPDKILIDAPCSGLGVLRRHPEGKWHKKPEIVRNLANLQRKLLSHAIEISKPGTEIIYSVCSFEPEESENHVKWLRKEMGERVEVKSIIYRLPDYYKKYVNRDHVLLIFSGNSEDMDGFGAFVVKVL
jgi:16S rRNA (cytosine967-C5)-methyltransferase